MKSAGKARNNGLYRHIRTSKEIIRNLLNDYCITFWGHFKILHQFQQLWQESNQIWESHDKYHHRNINNNEWPNPFKS